MKRTIWVVSRGTDAGKTTIAAALIRATNLQGDQCVGFKPFGAVSLRDSIDFITDEVPPGRLFGHDALQLARCSALTPDDLTEVVAPVYFLVFHWTHQILLVRSGSAALGSARLRRGDGESELWDRPDTQAVVRRKGWVVRPGDLSDSARVDSAHRFFAQDIVAAFEHLETLGADSVVVEGASSFLPVWHGQPAPDFIVVVERHQVHVLPGPQNWPQKTESTDTCPTSADLRAYSAANRNNTRTYQFPIAHSSRVDEVADELAGRILSER